MLPKTPPFDSLPLRKDGPPGNAWGLFGEEDRLGTLNRLTPRNTLEAAKEIKHGIRISTDWSLAGVGLPCFQREPLVQRIHSMSPRCINDDILSFNTQCSTQWDGFRHFGYQNRAVYFQGVEAANFEDSAKYGIDVWVENGGIVGRGVLIDWASWVESQGRKPDLLQASLITLGDLKQAASAQGLSFRPGDILFIRSGLIKKLEALRPEDLEAYMAIEPEPPVMGLESGEPMLRWLWESEFAAVAGDMMTLEAQPCVSPTHVMHEWMIAGWGMPIGELFDLEKLAAECRRIRKWSFFFSSMPLKVPGGIASPPNGVAIL
ncbi:hypothetical protein BX600DRAFT_383310 [Xylariales sp. PMI_506]|nr:hypothetical protein BX600DRAFT_383310 [Xylariales sp. PMI_506]